jgi:quinol monooxygenase YgiN
LLIAISARFEIAPEHIAGYIEAVQPVIAATRQEPGCRLYAFSRDLVEPNVVWVSEEWESNEALLAHFATEHVLRFREFLTGVTFISRDVRKYSVAAVGSI